MKERALKAMQPPRIKQTRYRKYFDSRKNWLFAGSFEGARRAALLYSLVQSSLSWSTWLPSPT